MTLRVGVIAVSLLLAAGWAAPTRAAALEPAVPEGGLVLDGGDLEASAAQPAAAGPIAASAAQAQPPRAVAFEYSDGYYKRLKVHKVASILTLPLFVTQFVLGQKLYDGNASDSVKSAHTAVAIGTGALFAVNTVTGVMNLREGSRDPSRSRRPKVHGIMMMVAGAGFVATAVTAPEIEEGEQSGNRDTHRAVAVGSMAVATAAYLLMLFGN